MQFLGFSSFYLRPLLLLFLKIKIEIGEKCLKFCVYKTLIYLYGQRIYHP